MQTKMLQKCSECNALDRCIDSAFDNDAIRCINFGKLKTEIDEVADELNSIGAPYPFDKQEIKNIIFKYNTIKGVD